MYSKLICSHTKSSGKWWRSHLYGTVIGMGVLTALPNLDNENEEPPVTHWRDILRMGWDNILTSM